eukprot:gene22626-29769_t
MMQSPSPSIKAGNNEIQVAPAIVPGSGNSNRTSIDARSSTQPKSIMKSDLSIWDKSSDRKTASRATIVEPRKSPTGNKERSSFMPKKGRSSAPQVEFGSRKSFSGKANDSELSPKLVRNIRSARHQHRLSPDKEVKESKLGWEAPQKGGTEKAPSRSQSRKFIRPRNLADLEDPNQPEPERSWAPSLHQCNPDPEPKRSWALRLH